MPAGLHRRSPRLLLPEIVRRYDRVARFYRPLEPLFLIFPGARRRAVRELAPRNGDTVLELGAGTGRNLPYLVKAVGRSGQVIAVDASPGMLAEAKALARRRGFSNVRFIHQDAAQLEIEDQVDGVLFSLSYSVMPEPEAALRRAWGRLRPGGRVVVMDACLPDSRLGRALRPATKMLLKLAPGDPDSRPWKDLAAFGPVSTHRFLMDLYFVCSIRKHDQDERALPSREADTGERR